LENLQNGKKNEGMAKMADSTSNLILTESLGEMPPELIKWIEEVTFFVIA
jgi:hypothetical protein